MFGVNDKITLKAARGGWVGFVAGIREGGSFYDVVSASFGNLDEGAQVVALDDIEDGTLDAPTYTVGQVITLYGMAGTITAENSDIFDVEVQWHPNKDMTLTRIHKAPLWRIAIENEA